MKNILFILCFAFLSSCTKEILNEPPLGYSFMPSYLDIDSILPFNLDDTNRVVDSSYIDFPSIPLDGGKLFNSLKDSVTIPPGILISDRKAALYSFYKSSCERQQKELWYAKYLMKEYYDKSKVAEMLYQKEIARLEKKAQRTWLEKNMAYIGFGSGLITMIFVDFALFQASR